MKSHTNNNRNFSFLFLATTQNRRANLQHKSVREDLVYNENYKFHFGNSDYILFEEKIPTVEVYIPHVIPIGLELFLISRIGNNMCYLNPALRNERLHYYLFHLNTLCQEPLSEKIINEIYLELNKNSQLGLIEPIYTNQRKVIFNKDCPIEIRNRVKAIASGKVKTKKTYKLIDDALNEWDLNIGKITNKKLAKFAGVHENTIKKYIKKYPELGNKKLEINKAIFTI